MANLAMAGIVKKMTGKNKDRSDKATSDLLDELNKEGFKADSDMETKLSNIVLQQLDVLAGNLLAVKCLSSLLKKISEARVVEMTNKLCLKLLWGEDEHPHVASIALKTIVSEVTPTSAAQSVLAALTSNFIKGITANDMRMETKCECLDFFCYILPEFGNLMAADHEKLLYAFWSQIYSNNTRVRTKSVSCIASLASSFSDDLLKKATVEAIHRLRSNGTKLATTRTNIQMIVALSCTVGYRIGPHLEDTVPLLITYCESASEVDEGLLEYCLEALKTILQRCSRDISSCCDAILPLTLKFLGYSLELTEMDEDTDDDTQQGYDGTWTVRRAALKCLAAVIVCRPEMLSKLYDEACPILIDMFKERVEKLQMLVFNTFIELLRQTGNVIKGQDRMIEMSTRLLLEQKVPDIVEFILKQLHQKSIETKVGVFSVLKELVVVLPNCLVKHIGSLIPRIEDALRDKSSTSNLKNEALIFTRLVLASHSPPVLYPYMKALSSSVISAGSDFNVTAEALRVCGELICVMGKTLEGSRFDFKPYIHDLYKEIFSRLTACEQAKEAKTCAISCIGLVISTFGNDLGADLPACFSVLVGHLGNETLRLTAVKAFAVIATSPLHIDLTCVLDHLITQLTAFLRKANRALRQATLETLNSLITYVDMIGSSSQRKKKKKKRDMNGSSAYEAIIKELLAIISDSDLHMTTLALELCCSLMADRRASQKIGFAFRDKVLPKVLTLIKSSLLQGKALQASQKFFCALVNSNNTSFTTLLDSLLSSAELSESDGVAKQAMFSIAECVADLSFSRSDAIYSSTIVTLTDILKADSSTSLAKKHLSLLCLGEIGRRKDLRSHTCIDTIVSTSLQSLVEEIKSAAIYALGNISVGYLPLILDQISNQQNKQYLLFHSLKEVIVRQSVDKEKFQNFSFKEILQFLFKNCNREEDCVRNVVAECLGKFALIEPSTLMPALKARTSSTAAFTRETVVIAVKYAMVERPEKIDEIISPMISSFFMLIKDGDRHVRRAAILALSTAAHNKPTLIKDLLPKLLPLLYNQTVVDQELIRTADLGPLKDIVVGDSELRKSAFECVDVLLNNFLYQMNPLSFILPYLKSGLDDHRDVKMRCHLILSKLADKCPYAVLAVLDSLVDPLLKTLTFKPKQDAAKQEVDCNEDVIRSALRVIASLRRISGRNCSPKLKNLLSIVDSPTIRDSYYFFQND